jgi:hypothetical protein
MTGADHSRQFHLASNTSLYSSGGALFQILNCNAGTEAIDALKKDFRFITFLSTKFIDAETRYYTTLRETLAVVRNLAQVKWLVIGSLYPVMVYTDHSALLTALKGGPDAYGRMARWVEQLSEFDMVVVYRPGKSNVMGVVDGLLRLSNESS